MFNPDPGHRRPNNPSDPRTVRGITALEYILIVMLLVGAVALATADYSDGFPDFWNRATDHVSSADDWPGDGGSGGNGGNDGGNGGNDDFIPDYTVASTIPYYWSETYQNWFPRPAGIPPEEWNNQPYTIDSTGDAVAITDNPNLMNWEGVTLAFTTPAPGETLEVYLTVGSNNILYTFTRDISP